MIKIDWKVLYFFFTDGFDNDIKQKLQTEGYSLVEAPTGQIGFINVVFKINETVKAYSDDRSGGLAAVF